MSKCLKCGSELPPVGECGACAGSQAPAEAPAILQRELQIDRRQRGPQPDARAIPSFAELSIHDQPTRVGQAPQGNVQGPSRVEGELREALRPVEPEPASLGVAPSAPTARLAEAPARKAVAELKARPAPAWRRIGAWAIDVAVVGAVVGLYFLAASAIIGAEVPPTELTGLDALMVRLHAWEALLIPGLLLALVLSLAYTAVFAVVWQGRTPGRLLFGLRLVDQSGLAPAPARAVIRALLTSISLGLFLGGFWLALFDRRGQTLHDKLTSTFVVLPV